MNDRPRVYIYDIGTGRQRLLVNEPNMTFAPRFSPDGRWIVFSMAVNGNTDIYRVPVAGGRRSGSPTRPASTRAAAIRRTAADRVRKRPRRIAAALRDERRRLDQRRISFGGGQYATPEWSPRGDLIAFTKIGRRLPHRRDEPRRRRRALLTDSWQDEGPSWAPNGRVDQLLPHQRRARAARPSSGRSISPASTSAACRRRSTAPTPPGRRCSLISCRFPKENDMKANSLKQRRARRRARAHRRLRQEEAGRTAAAADRRDGDGRGAERAWTGAARAASAGGAARARAPTSSRACRRPRLVRNRQLQPDAGGSARRSTRRRSLAAAQPGVRVTIEGHADERGTREYNLALGDRRANAAKNYLAAAASRAADDDVISWGKERPEAFGSDEGAWAQNRRAVTVVPQ
jgi:hypothetical protein